MIEKIKQGLMEWIKRSQSPDNQPQSQNTGFTIMLKNHAQNSRLQFSFSERKLKGAAIGFALGLGGIAYMVLSYGFVSRNAAQAAELKKQLDAMEQMQQQVVSENESLKQHTMQQEQELEELRELSQEIQKNQEELREKENVVREHLGLEEKDYEAAETPENAEVAAETPESGEIATETQEPADAEAYETDEPELSGDEAAAAGTEVSAAAAADASPMPEAQLSVNEIRKNLLTSSREMRTRVSDYEGYVKTVQAENFDQQLAMIRNNRLRAGVVAYATQFLGGKYAYGKNDPHTGVDCSGFTRYVLSHAAGVSISRTAASQSREGTSISIDEAKPGDLIFYGSGGSVDHVAIYMGDGKVIHASNEKNGIMISNWDYRKSVGIKNIIGDKTKLE